MFNRFCCCCCWQTHHFSILFNIDAIVFPIRATHVYQCSIIIWSDLNRFWVKSLEQTEKSHFSFDCMQLHLLLWNKFFQLPQNYLSATEYSILFTCMQHCILSAHELQSTFSIAFFILSKWYLKLDWKKSIKIANGNHNSNVNVTSHNFYYLFICLSI